MKTTVLLIVFLLSLFYSNILPAQKQDQSLTEFISPEEFKTLPEKIQSEWIKSGYNANSIQAGIQENTLNNTKHRKSLPVNRPFKNSVKRQPNSFALVKSLNQVNSSYYTEKLDSIVDYESIMVPKYDSLEVQNTKQKFDENGFLLEKITQDYDSTSNKLVNINKAEYNYNSDGNILRILNYAWSGEAWAISGKTDWEYNSNKQITSSSNYTWSGNSWNNLTKAEYEFDTQGNQTLYTYFRANSNNEWVIYVRVALVYHENGELANGNIYSVWNPEDSAWTSETILAYDESGRTIINATKLFNSTTKEMEYSNKTEYEYLEDESIVETKSKWNSVTQEFYQEYQTRYKFERMYENDKLTQEIRLNYIYGNWEYQYKRIYEYDQWGNQVLSELYDPYWGDYGEIQRRTIRAFSETGKLIKFEDYYWDFDYVKIGILFYEFEFDNDERIKSYTRCKWNIEKEEWLVDFKEHYHYPNEGEVTIQRYQFTLTGYNPTFIRYFKTSLNYNESIGKYTGLSDDMGYESFITYNENLKVDQVLFTEDGNVYGNVKCYYDKAGRDSLWESSYYSYYYGDTLIGYVLFSYSTISADEMEITEFYYDNQPDTIYDEYGNIIDVSSKHLIKYITKNGRILKSTSFDKSGDGWIASDSTILTYNINGQIETLLYEGEYYNLKEDYIFFNDTLFRNEYRKYDGEEWLIQSKTIYTVDPSVNKNQILSIPAEIFNEASFLPSYEFHLQYDYGKILEVIFFEYEGSDNFIFNNKSIVYYSPASALQGEGYISGYIFNESGENKFITTTTKDSGEPIEGVALSLCAKEDNFVLATHTTNAEGFFEFKGVPEGSFYLKINLEGYEQSSTYEMQVASDSMKFENKNFIIQGGKVVSNKEVLKTNIKVYPNPTSGKVTIAGLNPGSANIVRVYSYSGNVIYEAQTSEISDEINMYKFAAGIYILEIVNNNQLFKFKIVKQ